MLEKPEKGEWTCPGAHHLAIRLRVGREPGGDGIPRETQSCDIPNSWTRPAELEDFLGRLVAPGAEELIPRSSSP